LPNPQIENSGGRVDLSFPERAVKLKMIFFWVGPGLVRSGSAWRSRLFLLVIDQ
jgi:hypothetical protein